MNQMASALTGLHGERVALCDVDVAAVLEDLLAEVTVTQAYRNDEAIAIEAVYTFPLPLEAVLLDLEIELGTRRLRGVVVGKREAEARYEDAIADGDVAVMLETIEPGLYTVNVGNLLPGERAIIRFRYALLYRWSGDRLRLLLPTTIAPRYGNSPHAAHQAPESALRVEHAFSFRMEVRGALREAQFASPSHPLQLQQAARHTVLSLRDARAVMDRDVVVNVRAPQAQRSFVLCGQDGDGQAAVASFQLFLPGLQQSRPLDLIVVMDCSGSMQGDSIQQARQALERILASLEPADRMGLIAFGNTTRALSRRLLPCTADHLAAGRKFAASLQADMGGTEIGTALAEAIRLGDTARSADIFLVTDGQVADWAGVVEHARQSGHRVFTVGVGSAVSEAFVRELAQATGGACELVAPREGMVEGIVRHFERMRAQRARRVTVHWPRGTTHSAPARLGAAFEGDTVVACAHFAWPVDEGEATLEVETEQGDTVRQTLGLGRALRADAPDGLSTVARVAAAIRLKELDAVEGARTALRYRLVSPWTNCLVVAPQPSEKRPEDLPQLRKVPQTMAAGWSGMGMLSAHMMLQVLLNEPRGQPVLDPDAFLQEDTPVYMRAFGVASMEAYPDHADSLDEMAQPSDFNDGSDLPWTPPAGPLREPYAELIALLERPGLQFGHPRVPFHLLARTSSIAEFDPLLRLVAQLGVPVGPVIIIVLARILGGPLRQHVPERARLGLEALLDAAREARNTLTAWPHETPAETPTGAPGSYAVRGVGVGNDTPSARARRLALLQVELLDTLARAYQHLDLAEQVTMR